jgi:hypothetical protein
MCHPRARVQLCVLSTSLSSSSFWRPSTSAVATGSRALRPTPVGCRSCFAQAGVTERNAHVRPRRRAQAARSLARGRRRHRGRGCGGLPGALSAPQGDGAPRAPACPFALGRAAGCVPLAAAGVNAPLAVTWDGCRSAWRRRARRAERRGAVQVRSLRGRGQQAGRHAAGPFRSHVHCGHGPLRPPAHCVRARR